MTVRTCDEGISVGVVSGDGSNQIAIIEREAPIIAHQSGLLSNALGDQHSVKRVAVMKRQVFEQNGIGGGKVERLKAHLFGARDRIELECHFPQRHLDHDLGDRDGADINCVGEAFELTPFLWGETFGRCECPQVDVRVDYDSQSAAP